MPKEIVPFRAKGIWALMDSGCTCPECRDPDAPDKADKNSANRARRRVEKDLIAEQMADVV